MLPVVIVVMCGAVIVVPMIVLMMQIGGVVVAVGQRFVAVRVGVFANHGGVVRV